MTGPPDIVHADSPVLADSFILDVGSFVVVDFVDRLSLYHAAVSSNVSMTDCLHKELRLVVEVVVVLHVNGPISSNGHKCIFVDGRRSLLDRLRAGSGGRWNVTGWERIDAWFVGAV